MKFNEALQAVLVQPAGSRTKRESAKRATRALLTMMAAGGVTAAIVFAPKVHAEPVQVCTMVTTTATALDGTSATVWDTWCEWVDSREMLA